MDREAASVMIMSIEIVGLRIGSLYYSWFDNMCWGEATGVMFVEVPEIEMRGWRKGAWS